MILEIFSGFIVGLLVGVTGIGGGTLMTPLLLLVFKKSVHVAIATDLCFASVTKTLGFWAHKKYGHIKFFIVKRLLIAALPTSFIISFFFFEEIDSSIIEKLIAFVLILTSLAIIFGNQLFPKIKFSVATQKYITYLVGVLIGALVTLTSIGAGTIGTFVLCFLYNLSIKEIVGTDLAYAVPLTIFSALTHIHHADFTLLFYLLIGSIPGVLCGSHISHKIKNLKVVLGGVLFLIGIKMFF